jgi:pimeloyl-ACP methyl ester carboxylesterase/DNA-binding CsgD family transcriptional regulator
MIRAMGPPPVQYVTTGDGYRIAYAVSGEGRPLVLLPANLYDTQQTWQYFPAWMEGLASRFRVVQYDHRGGGMSTRGLPDKVTLADYQRDLETVVGRLKLDRFVLAAFGGRCHVAVGYAADHPEKVEALVLSAATLRGSDWRPVFYGLLPQESWDMFLRNIAPPGLTDAHLAERLAAFNRTVTLDDWTAWMGALAPSDISEEVSRLTIPLLVLHPREFALMTHEEPMQVAAAAPDGRFVMVEGNDHFGDATQALEVIDRFLAEVAPVAEVSTSPSSEMASHRLSAREVEVLSLIARGKSNLEIADALVISHNTVGRHVSNILDKIGASNRTEATAYALRAGIV